MNSGSEYFDQEEPVAQLTQADINFFMVEHMFVEKMIEFGLEETEPYLKALAYFKENFGENQDQG